eukprot:c6913_g1_i2.p1 GENE.c6913_g1_i2~~c6913_g1_i2.p1  ORF type:complete len:166 (-),score=26.23 c6913_g1_i2:1-498(-)
MWSDPNTAPAVSSSHTDLESFIKAALGEDSEELLGTVPKQKGDPAIIVMCTSAVRAIEVDKALRTLSKCKVGKLFAKHMKIAEQQQFLETSPIHVAVATPHRASALIETNTLKLSNLRLIVVDMSVDKKSCHLLNLPQVKDDFLSFVTNSCSEHFADNRIKIVLF